MGNVNGIGNIWAILTIFWCLKLQVFLLQLGLLNNWGFFWMDTV